MTKRKKAVQSGKEHVNNRGKVIPAKEIVSKKEKDCAAQCKLDCTSKIDEEMQNNIFYNITSLTKMQNTPS